MASNTGAGLDWGSLPSDILVLIFRRFHLRPLLLIARLVCRRWSDTALRSISTLPLCAPVALIRQPSVSRLKLDRRPSLKVADVLPPHILDLEYYSVHGEPCNCDKLRDLTGLTRLHLSTNGCCREPFRLVERNTRLTDLRFSMERATEDEAARLTTLRLPHLRSLELHPSFSSLAAVAFASTHASQLTHLYFPDLGWLAHPRLSLLPSLRSAAVAAHGDLLHLARLPQLAPALSTLGIEVVFSEGETLPPGLPFTALTSLSIHNFSTFYGDSLWTTLAEHSPNLTRLSMRAWHPGALRLTQLRELRPEAEDLASIGSMRRLTSLQIPFPVALWQNVGALKGLETLTIRTGKLSSLANLRSAVSQLVKELHLRKLKLFCRVPRTQWSVVLEIIRVCEQSGVQKLSLDPRRQASGADYYRDAIAAARWMDLRL